MANKDVIKDVIEAIKMALESIDVNYCQLSQIDYFKIATNIPGIAKSISDEKYLERPFAYEFYHQLRKLMENGEVDFGEPIIQAEVSKSYQHIFERRKTPDFLIHLPNARLNLAVIEFKLSTNLSELKNDLKKLVDFKTDTRLKYTYAIEVIIGDTRSLENAKSRFNELKKQVGEEITIIDFDTDLKKAQDWKIKYPVEET